MNKVNRSRDANRDPHIGTLGAPGLGTAGSSAVDAGSTPDRRSTSPRQESAVSVIPIARRADDHKLDTPPTGATAAAAPTDLALPHERDESTNDTAHAPDPMMVRAKRDIDAGLVDTDMHATPGLDAKRRAGMVPGAGGKPIRTDGSS